jgi:hypothetical protein
MFLKNIVFLFLFKIFNKNKLLLKLSLIDYAENTNNINTKLYNQTLSKKISIDRMYEGIDMRYDYNISNNSNDDVEINLINIYFLKKRLIDLLENKNNNENSKMDLINENKILIENKSEGLNQMIYNVYNGGLMKDWNF